MSKVLFRPISFVIFVVSCNFAVIANAQQTINEVAQIDVLESVICTEPRRCLPHYQCTEDGVFNKRGVLVLNPRFDDEDSDTLRDGNDVYEVPANNTIILKSGGEAKICHYLERCCGNDPTPAPPTTEETRSTANNKLDKGCGYRNPDGIYFKIKTDNNRQAQYGEFPWVVAVLWDHPDKKTSKLTGGGSLLHPNVVLTAAHIVADKSPNEFNVRAGEWDTQTDRENLPYQERSVKKILIHEQFYQPVVFYDIALLIVDTPFELIASIQPICLPASNLQFDNVPDCYAAGWGKDIFSKEGRRQSILKKLRLPIVPFDTCQEQLRATRLGDFFELHESFICAGGKEGQDTCTGDGGAPLICPVANEKNRYYQTGIVAWGIGCGAPNIPGVYANVALMRNWVDSKMMQEGFGTDSYTIK